MGGAGSSFGIVTEFLYRIYQKPETLPIISLAYVESPDDLRKLEKAATDGRYHVTWFMAYAFRDLSMSKFRNAIGLKILPKILKSLARKSVEPTFVHLVDNSVIGEAIHSLFGSCFQLR